MELNIQTPIEINISVNEIEEGRVNSFKSDVSMKIPLFNFDIGLLLKNAWFDCGDWDVFTERLISLDKKTAADAMLSDMSRNLNILIEIIESDMRLKLKINRNSIEGAEVDFFYKIPITRDQVKHIHNAFSEFPRWW